jgi:O-antigen/teichoic acid export membrane protein
MEKRMTGEQSSYRQIMKATSLFGGVEVFNILIVIIRSKFIAVLLGPTGMGIAGLLLSTTNFIGGLTGFGLGTSAVRDISAANSTGDRERISTVVTVFRRLIWITGTLGMVVTLVLSPLLSRFAFGNYDYTLAFILISVILLIGQLSAGQMVLLKGMRKLQYLAKANVSGGVLGLLVSIPLYYVYGIRGIVPAIVLTALVILARSWYFSRKVKLEPVKVSRAQIVLEGKGMVKMGLMVSLNGLFALGTSYILRIYIGRTGGVDQVGLYTAGFAIISTYVGLIFSAMGTDYYPRLSAVAHSNELCRQIINQQAEIALLILAPIISIFLIYINWLVVLLYSTKFIAINNMIHWAALGMIFKAPSWAIAYILLVKKNVKHYFWSEIISICYLFGLNILGYSFWGLTGLGISYLIAYVFSFIQLILISKYFYNFSFKQTFVRIFIIQLFIVLICFIVVEFLRTPYNYLIGTIFISLSSWYSYVEIDKRIGIKQWVKTS